MRLQRIEPQKLGGIGDKVFGLGKEIVGEIFDRDSLRKEGEAQQKKGAERLKALKDEVKATAREAKADTYERQQRAAQKMKESA